MELPPWVKGAGGAVTAAELEAVRTAVAGGVLKGNYPNPGFAVDMATQAEIDAALADVATLADLEAAIATLIAQTTETLFYANFATENTNEFPEEQALPGRISTTFVANVGEVATFEIQEGDPEVAGGHRSELRDGNRYIDGDDALFAIKLRRLAGDWTQFHIPFQLHDESEGGSTPVCLMFKEMEGRHYIWLGPGNSSATWWRYDITGNEEAWLDLLIRVKVSATEGEVQVWKDGVLQEIFGGGFVKQGLNTLGVGSLYSKIGSYRSKFAVGLTKVQIAWLGVMKRLVR